MSTFFLRYAMRRNKNESVRFFCMVDKFLNDYLPLKRTFSENTINSYRMALQLLRNFFLEQKNIDFTGLQFSLLSRENIYDFLMWLKEEKGNKPSTLNQRMAAIKSFLSYCSEEDMELTRYYLGVCSIHQFKESQKRTVDYLKEHQLKRLFQMPLTKTKKGRRNLFLMILMYETGARIQELLDLRLRSIIWNKKTNIQIRIQGKGKKQRLVPLLGKTVEHLDAYLEEFHDGRSMANDEYLFFTIHKKKKTQMQQGTVDSFLKIYSRAASEIDPLFPESIHAHMLRHSVAMAMYKKGIPISYIRDFLGHTSVETTSVYAYADDLTICEALEKVSNSIDATGQTIKKKNWKEDEKLLLTLCGLK